TKTVLFRMQSSLKIRVSVMGFFIYMGSNIGSRLYHCHEKAWPRFGHHAIVRPGEANRYLSALRIFLPDALRGASRENPSTDGKILLARGRYRTVPQKKRPLGI